MSYSDNNSFEQIMERMLAIVPSDVDKRVGSIIYDTLAPTAMELADAYVKMDILEEQTYLLTATGENLDKKVYDYGVKRIEATKAKRIGEFKTYEKDSYGNIIYYDEHGKITDKDKGGKPKLVDMDIPINSRFSTDSPNITTTFIYTGIEEGHKILLCEQFGTIGNNYSGTILPIDTIPDLIECSIISTYKAANDRETDEELRNRTQETNNKKSFGGNIPDYIEKVKEIEGTGNCKVFPAWKKNGSVLLSVVDPQYNPITSESIERIQNLIDPPDPMDRKRGKGIGIAPIGHYVTVTTPVKQVVNVSMKVTLDNEITLGMVREDIKAEVEKYFDLTRHQFKQGRTLMIYVAKIIDYVLNVKEVLNVQNVLLNGKAEDIKYTDVADVGKQYLPYTGEVTIG